MTETTTSYPDVLTVHPARNPVTATLAVPGSKSIGNRAILLAGFASGESELRGILDSDDTRAALRSLQALGIRHRLDGDAVVVSGTGTDFPVKQADIDIGSSGTVGRFLPGLLAACPDGEWCLTATEQLAARPLKPLVDGLREWGARITEETSGRSFPLTVSGGGLAGGAASVSAARSSQFASGLLMAAPLCRQPAVVRIHDLDPDETYIDMTRDLMRRFGAESEVAQRDGVTEVSVASPHLYRAASFTIEADANTANYFLALAALTDGEVTIDNLDPASRQPGVKFLDVYERLGCTVRRAGKISVAGNPLPLWGGFTIDMRAMSEMALTLGILAVFADAPITMTNLAHIRGHESDRIAALASQLRRVGVRTDEEPDAITIHPLPLKELNHAVIDPHDDHRLAMSFAVLGAAGKGIAIENPACVKKTCPAFFTLLSGIGLDVSR